MDNTKTAIETVATSRALLDAVYNKLDYEGGSLLTAVAQITPETKNEWLEKGDWLTLASTVKADKVFFVNNDPVVVFYEQPQENPEQLQEIFRQVWCMSRPQCLFIATPSELKIYSLNRQPTRALGTWEDWEQTACLERLPFDQIAQVQEVLQAFSRAQVESGQLFMDKDFGSLDGRADKSLIEDLKTVRQELLKLNKRNKRHIKQRVNRRKRRPIKTIDNHIHALIGRSIFIRYLEDRGILIPEYFQQVAQQNPLWQQILDEPERRDLAPHAEKRIYVRVLRDHAFTYALFDRLAKDFNGDMFPSDSQEKEGITQKHLDLLRGFLLGDSNVSQRKLFLWSYDFNIIPIELISNIYEQFYHKTAASKEDTGTHYTPSSLVEYVLSEVLTPKCLDTHPRVLDFAAGSGIFLVHTFRRMIRYQEQQINGRLNNQELRQILRNQICGIEINHEAVRIAAFSLYLALLHYQEPKSILAQIAQANHEKPLPRLIYQKDTPQDSNYYPILFKANAFSLMPSEKEFILEKLEKGKIFAGRKQWQKLADSEGELPFEPNSFDVIVSNPPWGKGTSILADTEKALNWCQVFEWPIGDKEMSQAFIARSTTLLKPNGVSGLLVSAGVFLKRGDGEQESDLSKESNQNNQLFRQRWLEKTTIHKFVNFIHVRKVFFKKGTSPFCFVYYQQTPPKPNHYLQYWSMKKTDFVGKTQSVILHYTDIHKVEQTKLITFEKLWKVYWWGNHRDAALVIRLDFEKNLLDYAEKYKWKKGRGFQGNFPTGARKSSQTIQQYPLLSTKQFTSYGHLENFTKAPKLVNRLGELSLYSGWRLLVKRGITQANNTNGRIEARLEEQDFCFQHSIHGISLVDTEDWLRKTLLGILWSSLARYYFFMTTSSWGSWHHEINLQNGLLSLPIILPNNLELRQKIVAIVDELRNLEPVFQQQVIIDLEKALDQAIFELYELNEAEQDLVLDLCKVGLEFFYRQEKSQAVKRVQQLSNLYGTIANLPGQREQEQGLQGYLYAFLQMWNPELEEVDGEFSWRVIHAPHHVPMLAVVFTTQTKGEPSISDEEDWQELLTRLDKSLTRPISSQIYIEGIIRHVSDTEIVIIKRDERRLWTRSLAREDAEATLLQAIHLQEQEANQ